jgi:hypothetical protein
MLIYGIKITQKLPNSLTAIVATSGCINKATKYTSHVEKEGEA